MQPDYILTLNNIDYRLLDVAGVGGSSIVYLAEPVDNPSTDYFIIKEFFPHKYGITRETEGTQRGKVLIPPMRRDEFEKLKTRVWEEHSIVKELRDDRASDPSTGKTNSGWFMSYNKPIEANNTLYTIITTESGKMLSHMIKNEEFKDFGKICDYVLMILAALKPIHDKGFLHLDVSPDNIHFSDTGIARLIDYNSAFRLGGGTQNFIKSFKPGYSAKELMSDSRTKPISYTYATDLYSVAAIFFRLLIGRTLATGDWSDRKNWLLNSETGLLAGASNLLIHKTNNFLIKGIANTPSLRFQKVDDMQKVIKDLRETFINPISLCTKTFIEKEDFVGRKTELEEIENKLKEKSLVFLYGIGGIGKSELARQYIAKQKDFKDIVYVQYSNNLARDMEKAVKGFQYQMYKEKQDGFKTEEDIFEKVLFPKLQELLNFNPQALLYIDNFDTGNDPYLEKMIEGLECKIIITTRHDYRTRKPGHVICIKNRKQDINWLKQLFYDNGPEKYRVKRDSETDDYVTRLIEALDRHTLAIKMLARQIRALRIIDLKEAVDRYNGEGFAGGYETAFYADLSPEERTAYGHIRSIFKFSGLNEEELEILKVMTHIPLSGIDQQDLRDWCGFKGESGLNSINTLINSSWIQEDEEVNVLSIYPLISEVVWREFNPSIELGLLAIYRDNLLEKIIDIEKTAKKRRWFLEAATVFILRTWQNTKMAEATLNTLYSHIYDLMDISRTDSFLEELKGITPIVLKKYSIYSEQKIFEMLSIEVLDLNNDGIFTKEIIVEAVVLLAWIKPKLVSDEKFDQAITRITNSNIPVKPRILNDYFCWFNRKYLKPYIVLNSEPIEIKIENSVVDKQTIIEIEKSDGNLERVELISCFKLKSTDKKYLFYSVPGDSLLSDGLVKMYAAEIAENKESNTGEKIDEETWVRLKHIMQEILEHGSSVDDVIYIDASKYVICEYIGDIKEGKRHGKGKQTWANGDIYKGDWEYNSRSGHGIFIFFNGDIYEGEFKEGKRHGKGKLTLADGDIYEGDYKEGKRHGKGKLTRAAVIYEGDWENDFPSGYGIFSRGGGTVYEGELKEGKRHGKGKQTGASGDIYEGDWENDTFSGYGILSYKDGTVYEGDYKEGKHHGKGKITWADGDIYEGDWENGTCSGYGIFSHGNGTVYEGEFKEGKPHGKGKLTTADGDIYEGDWENGTFSGYGIFSYKDGEVYEGEFKEGKPHGRGKITSASGDIYEGDYKEGKRHGKGKQTGASGDIYEGDWENDTFSGYGILSYKDGTVYEGDYKEGKRHGKGKQTGASGDIYEGDWENDTFSGYGILSYKDGTVYEGEFKESKRHGKGKLTWADGDIYEGDWENDFPSGYGILSRGSGTVYEGEFKEGKYHGKGKQTLANGNIYEGDWENGTFSGYGIFSYKDGEVYEGEFKEGKPHGRGKITSASGDIYEGDYKEGKRHGKGKQTGASGDIYEGDWENDTFSGYGIFSYKDGTVYEGEYKEGKPHGKGKITSASGDIYEGDYKEGKYHGKGKLIWADGDIYEGDWENDTFSGYGIFSRGGGTVYEGELKEGKRHGKGKLTTADGDIYEGDWENDFPSGYGIFSHGSGTVYEGEFKEGEYHGKGKLTWADGDIYEGDWEYNSRSGHGIFIFFNGDIYEGEFKEGEYHGKGKLIWADGDIYEGDWKNDIRHGKGKLTWASGDVYEGEFKEDKRHGKGKLTRADGDIYEGDWENDVCGPLKKVPRLIPDPDE